MNVVRILMLVLHISAAAMLLGAGTGLMGHLRRTLEVGGEAFRLATLDGERRGRIMGICSLVTLLTGLGLIFLMGGFKAAPLNFHIALGNMLVAIAVSAAIVKPASAKLVEIAARPELDRASVPPLLKKLQISQGILHTLWLANLVLMLVRIYR